MPSSKKSRAPLKKPDILRTIDANFNRVREALRVIEDGMRFYRENRHLAERIRNTRREFSREIADTFGTGLGRYRDIGSDFGKDLSQKQVLSFREILSRNFSRASEGLRTIEEYGKLLCPEKTPVWALFRFKTYEIESDVMASMRPEIPRPFVAAGIVIDDKPQTSVLMKQIIRGKPDIIELLCGNISAQSFLEAAKKLRDMAPNTLVFIAGRPDIARLARADGVVLGDGDLAPEESIKIFPDGLVCLRIQNPGMAERISEMTVSLIAVCPVFQSVTYGKISPKGLALLTEMRKKIRLPIMASGGITPLNIPDAVKAGADGIGLGTALRLSQNPTNTLIRARKILKDTYGKKA